MPALLPIALAALTALPTADQAVAAALAVPGARVEVLDTRLASGPGCPAAAVEALRPVTASGEVPLRLRGTTPDGGPCQAFGWARVRVLTPGLITARALSAGEPLEGAVVPGEVELRHGRTAPLPRLPASAHAARALAAGAPLLQGDVREGPGPGEPIEVVIRTGGLEIAQSGRAVPCLRGRVCAVLPGGRRVMGRLEDGHLLLEEP